MSQNPITGREESVITEHSTGIRPGGDARKQTALFDYNFSRDGGAIGTVLLRGPPLPDNAVISNAFIDVLVVPASGDSATIALGFLTTTDIQTAAAYSGAPYSSVAQADLSGPTHETEGGFIKLTSARGLQMTIATAALTDGHFYVIVEYDVTE